MAYSEGDKGVREAMRFIDAGEHTLAFDGGTVGRLQVRRVPEILYCKFQYDPWVHHDGPYDWSFLQKHMLMHVNMAPGWDQRGVAAGL